MKYTCKRCNHTWQSIKEGKPVVCPRCKSYSYDKEYVRKPIKKEGEK